MRSPLRIEIVPEDNGTMAIADGLARLPARPDLVRLDGAPYAGKSTLARRLATTIGGIVVSTDDHLNGRGRHGRTYPELVDRPRLLAHVKALQASGLLPVLEGIWLEAVAPPNEFGAGFRVLVRFIAPDAGGRKDVSARNRQFHLSRYYREFRPEELADVVATRRFDSW